MKVKELIEELSAMDQEAEVMVPSVYMGWDDDVCMVETGEIIVYNFDKCIGEIKRGSFVTIN